MVELKTIEKLLKSGVKLTVDVQENSVLHLVCKDDQYTEVIEKIKLFLEKDSALLQAKNKRGELPMHMACMLKRSDVTQYLIGLPDVDVNARNNEQETALHVCAMLNNEANARVLLSHAHIDVNLRDKRWNTPCHYAAMFKRQALLGLLQGRPDFNSNVINSQMKTASDVSFCYYCLSSSSNFNVTSN